MQDQSKRRHWGTRHQCIRHVICDDIRDSKNSGWFKNSLPVFVRNNDLVLICKPLQSCSLVNIRQLAATFASIPIMPLSRRAPQDLNFPLVDADALLNLRAFIKKCILPDLDHSDYDGPFYKTRIDPHKYPNSLQIRPESWRLLELIRSIPSQWSSSWLKCEFFSLFQWRPSYFW